MTSTKQPTDTPDHAPEVEAVFLNPADLEIDGNVRQNFNLDNHPDERDSIQMFGVKNPIKAVRESNGQITVIDGQIRTLIALVLGLDQVPVWIERAPDTSTKQRTIARITEQINLNDRRIPLTTGDRAAGIAQLLHLGVSVTRVANSVQEKDLDKIRQAARIGTSATARKLVDDNQLDFEQAAILADYETHGDTEAVQRLLDAPRHYFAYEANLIARQRAEAHALFDAALPYAASGFAIATDRPDSIGADAPYLPADALCTSEGQPVTPELLSADAAEWVVYLEVEEDGLLVDRDTGETVDPDTVDPNTKGRPDVAAADGYRHAETTETRDRWTPHYFLPADKLDTSRYQLPTEPEPEPEPEPVAPEPEPAVTGDTDSPASVDNPDVVEDLEAARVAREQARAEQRAREAAARQAREEAEREAQRVADLRKKLTAMFATATTTPARMGPEVPDPWFGRATRDPLHSRSGRRRSRAARQLRGNQTRSTAARHRRLAGRARAHHRESAAGPVRGHPAGSGMRRVREPHQQGRLGPQRSRHPALSALPRRDRPHPHRHRTRRRR